MSEAAAICSRCGRMTKHPSQAHYWCEECEREYSLETAQCDATLVAGRAAPNHHSSVPGRVSLRIRGQA